MTDLAARLFAAYSRNSGNPPDCHFDRDAAEQWMTQALDEVGVSALIALVSDLYGESEYCCETTCPSCEIRSAIRKATGEQP